MTDPRSHLAETRARLSTSPLVVDIAVVEERQGLDYGYFRARLNLVGGDFLEVAEYFTLQDDRLQVRRYRYQWMDATQQVLRKRWDNTGHFPGLPGFPDHVHSGSEDSVEPGHSLTIVELITLLESEGTLRGAAS